MTASVVDCPTGSIRGSKERMHDSNISTKLENIWKEVYTVRSYEIDANARLSVPVLCNFMQDAAGKHAHSLGVSVRQLRENNNTWVLSRLALQMKAYPCHHDQFEVMTWPSGSERLFALREFLFSLGPNQIIGSASTAWLVIGIKNRRPLRIKPFLEKLNPISRPSGKTSDLPLFETMPEINHYHREIRFRVRYDDLDINQHVNNVSYVEWVIESIPAQKRIDAVLTGLEVHYQAEAFYGDIVISRCSSLDNRNGIFLHSVIKETNGQELLRARTTWTIPTSE